MQSWARMDSKPQILEQKVVQGMLSTEETRVQETTRRRRKEDHGRKLKKITTAVRRSTSTSQQLRLYPLQQ